MMITHKDVIHFYELLAEELRLSVRFSRTLTEHLLDGEKSLWASLHSLGVESIQDLVALRDLPHYPLNFMGLPPKMVETCLAAWLLFWDVCAVLSRYGIASLEQLAAQGFPLQRQQ